MFDAVVLNVLMPNRGQSFLIIDQEQNIPHNSKRGLILKGIVHPKMYINLLTPCHSKFLLC